MATQAGYSRLQIGLHWAIALLFSVNYIVSDEMGRALNTVLKGGVATGWTPVIHVYVGITFLALVVLRLVVRKARGVPAEPESGSELMRKAGRYTHYALYALMFVVPVFGMTAWYLGYRTFGDLHVLAMNALLILIGLHAVAALFHHYYLKDGLIRRMMRAG